jgi:hypothetical protein
MRSSANSFFDKLSGVQNLDRSSIATLGNESSTEFPNGG